MYASPESHVMLRGLVHQGLGNVERLEDRISPTTTTIHQVTHRATGGGGEGVEIVAEIDDHLLMPGARPVVEEAWDTSGDPATYRVQMGDTLAGLAITYLGDGTRWREIWDYQSPEVRATNTPDNIRVSTLRMPPEAARNFRMWVDRGKPGNKKPGEIKPNVVDKIGGKKTLYYAAGAAGVLSIGYLLLRRA